MCDSNIPSGDEVTRAVIAEAQKCLDDCLVKIKHCLEQLSDEQIWWRPDESMNAIGNLLLHLTGNVRQWIVSGIGGAEDTRHRPSEFSKISPLSKRDLLAGLEQVVEEAKTVLGRVSSRTMLATRRIQSYEVNGWGAIFDSVPHFRGHTQEIISYTRQLLGKNYQFHWQPQSEEEGA